MTKELTEQWKRNKLANDECYYVKTNWRNTVYTVTGESIAYEDYIDGSKIIEVLAPVPSYQEWQAKLEENTNLKELLKELRMSLMFDKDLTDKIDEVLK